MSPEQAFGREMDHRTDLFSLGIVMYELLVGKSLFRAKTDAETLARVRAGAVPEFEKVCDVNPMLAKAMRKVLSREQEERFASAAEFRRAPVEYLRTVTPPIEAATLGNPCARSCRAPRSHLSRPPRPPRWPTSRPSASLRRRPRCSSRAHATGQ
jgi:serine/threonine protein kinase